MFKTLKGIFLYVCTFYNLGEIVVEKSISKNKFQQQWYNYSASMWNLMKFKIPEIKPSQEARVCLRDYKNILHEFHGNKK